MAKKTVATETVDKKDIFEQVLKDIQSKYKHEEIYVIGDQRETTSPTIDSGSLVLNSILGGGIAKDRIIEIYGTEASGKTSIALTAIANVQAQGGRAVFFDCEQALDLAYASNLGVNVKDLVCTQAVIIEDIMGMIIDFCESKMVDIIVVDSVASMIPRAEFEDMNLDKSAVATTARVLSRALRNVAVAAKRNGCTVIFLNQTRANIGQMYGPQSTTTGGNALRFYASQRIEVKRKEKIEENGIVIGNRVLLKCIKNKIAPPFGEGLTVLTYAQGINRVAELLELGKELGVISKEGRTFYCTVGEDVDISGHNAERVKDNPTKVKIAVDSNPTLAELTENEALYKELTSQLVVALKIKNGFTD